MNSVTKNLFILMCTALFTHTLYADTKPQCYKDLTHAIFSDGYMSSLYGASGGSSLASGGGTGVGFGLPLVGLSSLHANQIRHTLKFRTMYHESLLGEGPTLDELAMLVFDTNNPNDDVSDQAYDQMANLYKTMIESGEFCESFSSERNNASGFTMDDLAPLMKSVLR